MVEVPEIKDKEELMSKATKEYIHMSLFYYRLFLHMISTMVVFIDGFYTHAFCFFRPFYHHFLILS